MIAADVVLLPPEEVMDTAVRINGELVEKTGDASIVLDNEKCLPHVTLAMGCVEEEDLDHIDKILRSIAEDLLPITLKTIPFEKGPASLKIEKTRDIELLHELVMIRMSRFFTHEVSKSMIYGSQKEEIAELTFDYIRNFTTRSSFENYLPHITLGPGDVDLEVGSFEFTARRLALCHLGNYCTCRKVLLSHTSPS
jgi:2'-5' RNA ligase